MVSRTAKCACGALVVTAEGEPTYVVACSCTQCQKRTGSIFGVSAYFPKAALRITGNSKLFTRVSDRGRKVCLSFCPECGTTVFWESSQPDTLGIAVGCFADPAFPPPRAAYWTESRHHWAEFPENVPTYQRGGVAPAAEKG